MSYEFLGSGWSLWPPHNRQGGLNVVSGYRVISAQIISACLTRPGEDLMHPSKGLSPDLFDPLSNVVPQYWQHLLKEEILKWVAGIERLYLEMIEMPDPENRLMANIQFQPYRDPTPHVLAFDFYEYQGAVWNQSPDNFLDAITLDGQSFRALV